MKERRKYTRVFFAPEDNMSGKLTVAGSSSEQIEISLLNISAGGLAFRPVQQNVEINKGDRFILTEITGRMPLDIKDADIEMVVRWVAAIPSLSSMGAGAEFVNISDELRNRIKDFIETF